MSENKLRYPSLNGLRAISILLVIFYHLNLYFPVFAGISNYLPILTDGQLGVNVFFVISGFLITGLLLKEESKTGTISLKSFYTRRTLRIFPAYYFLLLVYYLLSNYGYFFISTSSWISAITYTKYFNWQLDWYTAHVWSLSIEEHFYLMWPLIFLLGQKARKRFVILIIILVPLLRIYFTQYPQTWASQLSIFFRLDAIAIGCGIALYQDKILQLCSLHWKKIFYISAALLFFLLFIQDYNTHHKIHLSLFNTAFAGSFGTITNFLIAAIMLYSVFGPRGAWYKFLNNKVMNVVGMLSYSLYLWQQVFLYKTGAWFNQYPLNILLMIIAAVASYYLIEQPFLRIKKKISGTQKKYPYKLIPVP